MARTFTNIATQDTEGINLPGDFKVTAGPGRAVTIAGGGITVRNRQRPGESYIGAAIATTTVPVPQNTSGATRRYLLIARVIDPDFSPWQPYPTPAQVLSGPYFEPFLVPDVSSTARTLADVGITYSAVPLARLAITSGSTTNPTVEADLRQLARARSDTAVDVQIAPAVSGAPNYLAIPAAGDTTWRDWPNNSSTFIVPPYATDAYVTIALNQVQINGNGNFDARVNFGGTTTVASGSNGTNFDYNKPAANADGAVVGQPLNIYARFAVPDSLRGQPVVIKPQARRTYTTAAGQGLIWMGGGSSPTQQVIFDVRFRETLS